MKRGFMCGHLGWSHWFRAVGGQVLINILCSKPGTYSCSYFIYLGSIHSLLSCYPSPHFWEISEIQTWGEK